MQGKTDHRIHSGIQLCLLAMLLCLPACDSAKPLKPAAATLVRKSDPRLATAIMALAKSRPADEALALLVPALEADPANLEVRTMLRDILTQTHWHFTETTLDHKQPIQQIEFSPNSSLWVALAGDSNTVVRWNMESFKIESTLFPLKCGESRSIVFDPSHRSVVIERAGVALLCDAQTLKPIREIGMLPEFVSPASVVVFSSDGVLMAHPSWVSESDHSIVWILRDAAHGEIIRKSPAAAPESAKPLCAILDRGQLRVLNSDGTQLQMPVVPNEEITTIPAAEPMVLEAAQFAQNGNSALVLKSRSTHLAPEPFMLAFGENEDHSLESAEMLARFPWHRQPGVWTSLLRDPEVSQIKVDGNTATRLTDHHAPLHAGATVTSLTLSGDRILVADESGVLTIQRTLPLPMAKDETPKPIPFDEANITAIRHLTETLAATRCDAKTLAITQLTPDARMDAFATCDFDAVQRVFPSLDFSPVVTAIKAIKPKVCAPETLRPLQERILSAFTLPQNPQIEKAFESDDNGNVLKAIHDAGTHGPAAAKALELALASTHPEWIEACTTNASDLPPLLKALAVSRIAWLQDRKADALAIWPDEFPDLKRLRLLEDWNGWEQADYSQAYEKMKLCAEDELGAIRVPTDSTPEQRKAVFDRLTDAATVRAVGKTRYAQACLKAALAFSAFKEESENTFKLANIARSLGESPTQCLRAEAISLTALGAYKDAHARWISLITDQPINTHEPSDYAEAAYTAFENADPHQAMAILTTGQHRFPQDANFALRAGWVALLTGNSERAYRFLLTGRQIGYPEDKQENAAALLAIAAAQSGAAEDAAAFYQDLIDISADWKDPATIDSLEWPEELKSVLRQLAN